MSKLWQKGTSESQSEIAKKVEAFTVGEDYRLDQELVPFDIKASKVHARALQRAGILTEEELMSLLDGLSEIRTLWQAGNFEIRVSDEDMHTAIENYLVDKLGDLGKKIHTGRSRNDQVLTAMRLYEKSAMGRILELLDRCVQALVQMAKDNNKVPMPGFTHTRKAMLSSVDQWAAGYAELLVLQAEASAGVTALLSRSPLGTAAGFGTSLAIDREFEAAELGFDAPMASAATAQLSRGMTELQLVQYLAGITTILNRFAADVIHFSSTSQPYFDLDPVVCTGSSIMPQKKNPDLAELIRGGHSELLGCAATLQGIAMNTGSGYHRDLQLTKEPVLKAFQKTEAMLEAAIILVEHMQPDRESLQQACTHELFAAEAANLLVKNEGMTFRDAYRRVKENPALVNQLTVSGLMEEFTQTGSPGNVDFALLTLNNDE